MVCICYKACLEPHVKISQIVHEVKLKRQMAEPNLGFVNQLESLHKEGFFQQMADEFSNEMIDNIKI